MWFATSEVQMVDVVLDIPTALLVLVKGKLGLGILGSVHMPHRKQEVEYNQRLVDISLQLTEKDCAWVVLGGDWNRDVRTHAVTVRMLQMHNLRVVPMDNSVVLPKDFVCISGLDGGAVGKWLKEVGDHPVVWAQVVSSVQSETVVQGSKPVGPN